MPKFTLTIDFENEEEVRAYLGGETRSAPAPVTQARSEDANEEPEETGTRSDDETDSEGMPYDPDIHAESRALNADGTWRAKRGKSSAEKAARAAFKASGGAVTPPVVEEEPKRSGMPGMPGAKPVVNEGTPVTFDQLLSKTTGMMDRGKIDYDGIMGLYAEVGITDPETLETNESFRAALYAKLCEIEA